MVDGGEGSERTAEGILAEYVDGLGPGDDIDVESLCARFPEHADELRERVADWQGLADDAGDEGSATIQRLQERGDKPRYEIVGEFARGGMGAILRVWDRELRRTLAMKVVLGQGEERRGSTPAVDEKTLGRFVEEAQVTGQLDHPGIVPVHEIGLDAQGQVFFTMRLVKGDDLKAVFQQLRDGEGDWSTLR